MTQKRLLFVDDEPQVLHGLERMLRPMRHEWQMVFCGTADAALEQLDREPFDLLVTDMRMPLTDGASLLRTVADRHPSVLRLVLSGQAEEDLLVRAAGCAHQLLSKPFEAHHLKAKLEQTLGLRALLTDEPLRALVARLGSLPSLPSLYAEIVSELGSSYPSMDRVGAIVARDMAMTAKLLQLVNSAMFGVQRPISDAVQAVRFVGLETIKTLALSAQVFSSFAGHRLPGVDAEALWAHSLAVSETARAISVLERRDATAVAEALSGGLLHDIGKLVLADGLREEYASVVNESQSGGRPLHEVEQAMLGTTHAHVGAYLLGIWGLPQGIVASVLAHHTGCAGETAFGPVAAVSIANSLVRSGGRTLLEADEAWLQARGLGDWPARWASALGKA